jgi:hypothetical protein
LNIYLRSCMIQIIKVLRKHRKQLSKRMVTSII